LPDTPTILAKDATIITDKATVVADEAKIIASDISIVPKEAANGRQKPAGSDMPKENGKIPPPVKIG
jgi:hypothetical protein